MITRRMFHSRLLGAMALAGSPKLAFATVPEASVDDIWLNRLTFGATAATRQDISSQGREAWLAGQLAMGPSDPDLEARLQSARLRIMRESSHVVTLRCKSL